MRKFLLWIQILWGVVAFAQPTGTCNTGTTKMGTDGRLYGCVESSWKRLSEPSTATATLPTTQGITQNANGVVYVREADNSVRQLNNTGFTPIALTGQAHEVGKIIYDSTTKHFYQGVAGGKWHQIDNEPRLVSKVTVVAEAMCAPIHFGNVGELESRVDSGDYIFNPPVPEGSSAYQTGYNAARGFAFQMVLYCTTQYPINNQGLPSCTCQPVFVTDVQNTYVN